MTRKLTIEDCHKTAKNKGGKCLETEYKYAVAKMWWKCSEGHKWQASINNVKNKNSWCPHCAGVSKLTIEDCHKYAKSKGGTCLSTKYKNSKVKIWWKCKEGHKWEATPNNVLKRKNPTWCAICVGQVKYTIDQCKEIAKAKGGKCLSLEYKSNQSGLIWECAKGHTWRTSLLSVNSGNSWCPHCAGLTKLTIEQCRAYAKSKGGTCLSTEYINAKTPIKWQCKKKHVWYAGFSEKRHKQSWCRICSCTKYSLKTCQEYARNKKGRCLSTEYKHSHSYLKWECENRHIWKAKFSVIRCYNTWCPYCAKKIYKSETLCREIFEKYFNAKFPNVRPPWLEKLELDGYNAELDIAFEFNGRQHYEDVPSFFHSKNKSLEKQQARDAKKLAICKNRGVDVIVIDGRKYNYRKPKELKKYVINQIEKLLSSGNFEWD